jgi:hypothetical protein
LFRNHLLNDTPTNPCPTKKEKTLAYLVGVDSFYGIRFAGGFNLSVQRRFDFGCS